MSSATQGSDWSFMESNFERTAFKNTSVVGGILQKQSRKWAENLRACACLGFLSNPAHEAVPFESELNTIPLFLHNVPFSVERANTPPCVCITLTRQSDTGISYKQVWCVWAALLSRDVQGHVWMRGRGCTVSGSKYIHCDSLPTKRSVGHQVKLT